VKIILLCITIVIFTGCEKKAESVELTNLPNPSCPAPPTRGNAQYEDYTDHKGRILWRMRGYWVSCSGRFGEARPYCEWRRK
jgi:hypothetical protein